MGNIFIFIFVFCTILLISLRDKALSAFMTEIIKSDCRIMGNQTATKGRSQDLISFCPFPNSASTTDKISIDWNTQERDP
jgi:hypothetical protein